MLYNIIYACFIMRVLLVLHFKSVEERAMLGPEMLVICNINFN